MVGGTCLHRRWFLRGGIAATVAGAAGMYAPASAGAAQPLRTAGDRAGTGEPTVFDTLQWQAREPTEPVTVETEPPSYIVVHHTVEPGNTSDTSRERAFEISRSIQNFHMDARGWIDTGQQFTISRGGYITEGRHRSFEILRAGSRHVLGTHVAQHNSDVIGIENEGHYSRETPTRSQWDSLVELVTYMADQYDIPPELIKGHRDFNSTECPGDLLYAQLPQLRAEVASRLRSSEASQTEWPLLRPGDEGDQVVLAQRLLREHGARVDVDGVFGPSTAEAAHELAGEHGLDQPTCSASARADEHGYLGADLWPLIVTGERSAAEWKQYLTDPTRE